MSRVTSSRNKRVKYVRSLQNKARLRRGEGKLILEGDRLIRDALQSHGTPSLALYSPGRADYGLVAQLQAKNCEMLPVADDVLAGISDTRHAPGMLAVFHIPKPRLPKAVGRALILDAVREPGNMGAILRSAAAAGVDIAILAPGCVDPYNSKVLRAGMGAHFRLPIVEASWGEIRGYCGQLAVYGAAADGDRDYTAVDWQADWALILGGEAGGFSDEAVRLARAGVRIPMARGSESLNVAAAAAVILFEARRQRQ